MRELFQALDTNARVSILKLLALLIKESSDQNDNSDWILAFNEVGFNTNDIDVDDVISNIDMEVYNEPLESWQIEMINFINYLENILIFRYVANEEAKGDIYILREFKTYRGIDKYRPRPLYQHPLTPEEVVRLLILRALKVFGNETNIWFDSAKQRLTLTKGFNNSYISVDYNTNAYDIWIDNEFMERRYGRYWNDNEGTNTLFFNERFKSGTILLIDELFKELPLNIRYNPNVGMGLHIIAE